MSRWPRMLEVSGSTPGRENILIFSTAVSMTAVLIQWVGSEQKLQRADYLQHLSSVVHLLQKMCSTQAETSGRRWKYYKFGLSQMHCSKVEDELMSQDCWAIQDGWLRSD